MELHTNAVQTGLRAGLHIPTLRQALETFVRLELRVRERSPLTVRWYRERLETMIEHLGNRPPGEVMDVDLLDWLAALHERRQCYGGGSSRPVEKRPLSIYTLQGYVRAARRFWRWLAKKHFIEANPAEELPMPPKPKVGKRGISDADQGAILAAARPLEGLSEREELMMVRDFAVLSFLAVTGCRLGGLAHLRLGDLRLDDPDPRIQRRAYVIEKGKKGRYVFLDQEAVETLRSWLAVRPECADNHVFIGCANGETSWHALREGGLYQMVKRYAIKAGVAGTPEALWSPHQWRHRFGRHWLERGGDLSRLSQLMGHSTSQITSEYYGQFEVDALQEGYDDVLS